MNLNKKLFVVGIIGSVLCFAGDMLLGCFTPTKEFGNSRIFPPFSDDWANSSPYRFVIGGLFGVIALLLMFCGFYAIYREMIAKKCKYSKLFIICAFVFVSVGTLYHCVFAMTAYIYNRLYTLQVLESKLIAEQLFFVFIAVASLAAVAFAGLSVYLFFMTITGKFNNERWLSIFNPLLIMLVLIILSKILPANKVVNGVFAWGQQSIALFITFMMFLICSIRNNHG
ncbi:MAG: hypothetical protein HFE44_17770 [Oscillospiraceae bacterium]|jgi:hypothetical protein|nr:hypothetical protein [Oscillospiraceae bacterium]